MFATVHDAEILEACERARDKGQRRLSLDEAWERLAGDQFEERAISCLAQSSAEALIALLERQRGESLVKQVRHVLQLKGNGREAWDEASRKMELACTIIAGRSALSTYRMKNWFGLEALPVPTSPTGD